MSAYANTTTSWEEMTVAEQLGNIGSEVSRALRWHKKDDVEKWKGALWRALDLFDRTLTGDDLTYSRMREINRAREVVCDYFLGGNRYGSTPESLNNYFTQFAIAARARKGF